MTNQVSPTSEATGDALAQYNFKEFKPVIAVSRTSLRRGQAALYDLLAVKIKTGKPVTIKEARNIWLEKVCQNMIDGKPHRGIWYAVEGGERQKFVPMSPEEINFSVLNWLTKNIGILVMRGYLQVIPMVELV
jgi:hypothetical protein